MTALIKGRRSIRRYRDEEVAAPLIDELIDTAGHAPTGVNAQGVLFTVVKERAVMKALRQEVMTRLGQLKARGGLPEGFVAADMGRAVAGWEDEGRAIIFRGPPHPLLTSAPPASPGPPHHPFMSTAAYSSLPPPVTRLFRQALESIFASALELSSHAFSPCSESVAPLCSACRRSTAWC